CREAIAELHDLETRQQRCRQMIALPPAVFAERAAIRNAVLGCAMQSDGVTGSLAALRRKLRALAATAAGAGGTAPEKGPARALKKRLEQRLRQAGAPEGDWSDHAFRLGRWVKNIGRETTPDRPNGDWTDHMQRLGKALRRTRKWLSE